jgi:uncharacterized membrane protein
VIDRFLMDMKLFGQEGELAESALQFATEEAERFLRAGGRLSWLDWKEMGTETRAAFIAAGNRLASERALIPLQMSVEAAEHQHADAVLKSMAESIIGGGSEGRGHS